MLQKRSWIVATETSWPTNGKIWSIWHFTENICWPLVQKSGWQPGLCPQTGLGSDPKLGKPLNPSEPHFPYLYNGDNNTSFFMTMKYDCAYKWRSTKLVTTVSKNTGYHCNYEYQRQFVSGGETARSPDVGGMVKLVSCPMGTFFREWKIIAWRFRSLRQLQLWIDSWHEPWKVTSLLPGFGFFTSCLSLFLFSWSTRPKTKSPLSTQSGPCQTPRVY